MKNPCDLSSISSISSADIAALEALIPADWPEGWCTLANFLFQGLFNANEEGVSHAAMARLAVKQVQIIAHQLGGQMFYIPRGTALLKKAMAEKLKSEFTGRNYVELAMRHNLTTMRVRQIVDADRPKARRARKGDQNGSQPVPNHPKEEMQPEVAAWPFKRL